jgi:hypothetical protein
MANNLLTQCPSRTNRDKVGLRLRLCYIQQEAGVRVQRALELIRWTVRRG